MRKVAVMLGIFALAMIAGCGQQEQEAQVPEQDTLPEITIINGLEAWNIYAILIDPSDSPWSEDRLGEDEILAPGESFTLEVTEGSWDIMVTDEDFDTYTLWQVEIGSEGYVWNVTLEDIDTAWDEEEFGEQLILETGEGAAPVVITNNLDGWDIYFVYVSPPDSDWGDDCLGMDILAQDDEITVWVDPGNYDIRAEDVDGDTYTLWDVEVDVDGYYWFVTLEDID